MHDLANIWHPNSARKLARLSKILWIYFASKSVNEKNEIIFCCVFCWSWPAVCLHKICSNHQQTMLMKLSHGRCGMWIISVLHFSFVVIFVTHPHFIPKIFRQNWMSFTLPHAIHLALFSRTKFSLFPPDDTRLQTCGPAYTMGIFTPSAIITNIFSFEQFLHSLCRSSCKSQCCSYCD